MQTQNISGPVSGSSANPYLADLWQQATELFEAGEHEATEDICQQLIFLAPERPMPYSLMSRLCLLKGQVRPAALNAFLASRRADGAHWQDIIAISSTLREVGECHLAHEVLSLIDPQDPANHEGLLELAQQYNTLDDQLRALHCIERARSLGNTGWVASDMLGSVLTVTGPVERAVAACEDSVAQNTKCGHAHWLRAQFGLKEGAELRVQRVRNALAGPGLGTEDVTFLQYALFEELDALDRTEEAWLALKKGANARRSVTEFNIEKENRAFDALIRVASARFLDRCGAVPTDVMPIFIVGMPHSGITEMQRVLGNHPQIAACGELDDFRQQMQWVNNVRLPEELDGNFGNFVAHLNYSVLGRRYLEKTRWLTEGKAMFIDSQPMNFMLCGPIMRALPHAKIIHLRRHPMDSCFSDLKTLFANGSHAYSYVLDELANHYRNYDRLMRHWHSIAPGRILDVRYEDLIALPELQAMRAQKYLGVPAIVGITETPANKKDVAASNMQPRQMAHGRKVGGWRRYQQGLAPLQTLLADLIVAYEAPGKAILLSRL
jgi:hypothetical protein